MLGIAGEKDTLIDGSVYIKQGGVSLELDSPLANGRNYKLSFWIKKPPPTLLSYLLLKRL